MPGHVLRSIDAGVFRIKSFALFKDGAEITPGASFSSHGGSSSGSGNRNGNTSRNFPVTNTVQVHSWPLVACHYHRHYQHRHNKTPGQ